jgi:amicyanin
MSSGKESKVMNSRDRSTRAGWVWRLAVAAMAALGGLAVAAWAPAGQLDSGAVPDRMAQRVAVSAPPGSGPRLEIAKHKYSSPTLTVPVGTTVTWINRDDDVHTVVSTTLAFRSGGLETDEAYSFKFTTPGVYEYFCTLHPLMTGKVIVK